MMDTEFGRGRRKATPVLSLLSKVMANYEVAIEEALTFELEIPVSTYFAEADNSAIVWMDADELSAMWAGGDETDDVAFEDVDF